jgi:uncharacterized repeat protein (TIGR01451 family)
VDEIFASGFEAGSSDRSTKSNLRSSQLPPGVNADILAVADRGYALRTEALFADPVDIAVEKTLLTPGPIQQDDLVTYQIVVQNLGPGMASDFLLEDAHSHSLNFQSGTCGSSHYLVLASKILRHFDGPTLSPNGVFVCEMTFRVTSAAGGTIKNDVRATRFKQVELDFSNNRSSVSTLISN